MYRRPLRQRVALTCGLIGLLLSVCFALATTFVAEEYEHILMQAMLDGQARATMAHLQSDPGATIVNSERFAGYREQDAPAVFRGLPAGVHDVEVAGREGVHAAVYDAPGQRWVFVIEAGPIEVLERYLASVMGVIVSGGTLLAAWLGWLLANRAIRPVAHLADSVAALPVRPVPTAMAAEFPAADELGRLAGAIDGYQQRLVEVDAAEKVFFGNASHELRTPIAVIQGAVEVLFDDVSLTPAQRGRIGRIDRAAMELASLLEALLLAARGVPAAREDVDIVAAVTEALARIATVNPEAARRVAVAAAAPLIVAAPPRWSSCIVSVLLQRLLAKAPGTCWEVHATGHGLEFLQPDGDSGAREGIQRSDLGVNLMFVERLCHGLGWRLEQQVSAAGVLALRLHLR